MSFEAPPGFERVAVWYLGFIGLCVGSFLNVVIARVPEGLSVVKPRSRCPKCGHQLAWYENVPVLSWVLLRGKCKGCKAPISPRYAVVELLTGLLFVAAQSRFGFGWELVLALVFVSFVVPLVFIDAERWILPFELTLPGLVFGLACRVPLGIDAVLDGVIGLVVAFVTFRVFELLGWLAFKKEALGGGDKFLLAMIGAFLSWRVLFGVIFLSSLQAAIFGIARLAFTGRAGPQGDEQGPEPAPPTMTWDFAKPGLSFGRRLALLPWSIFLQPIPDDPVDEKGEEIEWQPEATNLPFGPWLGLAALEIMLFGPVLGGWLSEGPMVSLLGLG